MARELNLFQKYGLDVTLHRELGWASIRDKVIYGELDAAHAIAAMPVAATLGLGSIRCDCVTGLILNLHGNAITLSNHLWQEGVRDGASLRELIQKKRGTHAFTFGVVYPFSSHRHLLRKWMTANGINPDEDVRMVVVPPAQMVQNMKAGNLDGFCVGGPWNSVAVQTNVGWCAITSAELNPEHPEKVLMVRRDFAEKREAEHLALIAALLEAAEFCDTAENLPRIISTLSQPNYIGVTSEALANGISGEFDFGHGVTRRVPDFCVFHRNNANEPSNDKAAWTLRIVKDSGLCPDISLLTPALARKVFRPDIFDKAVRLRSSVISKPHSNEHGIHRQNNLILA